MIEIHRTTTISYVSKEEFKTFPLNTGDLIRGLYTFECKALRKDNKYTCYYDEQNRMNIVVL